MFDGVLLLGREGGQFLLLALFGREGFAAVIEGRLYLCRFQFADKGFGCGQGIGWILGLRLGQFLFGGIGSLGARLKPLDRVGNPLPGFKTCGARGG